jgi:LmbE family N-acetylglucosaminyl deacetylase
VLTGYDEHGGYGHPDHVHVHRVARRARELARTPVLLEASVDRTWLVRADRVVRLVPGTPRLDPATRERVYLSRAELTHRVDVREQVPAKRAALLAHHSQATGGPTLRTVSLLGRLPRPVATWVLGHEWFREAGRPPGPELLDDVFASLR